jgi:hypothetical protein
MWILLSWFRFYLIPSVPHAVNPGGVFEQTNTRHDREQIFVQPRLGFIRLALRHKLAIVPSYCFGENQLFTTYPAMAEARKWMARKFRVGLPLFIGTVNV